MSLYLFYIFIYIAVEFKVKLVLNFIYFVMCVVWCGPLNFTQNDFLPQNLPLAEKWTVGKAR